MLSIPPFLLCGLCRHWFSYPLVLEYLPSISLCLGCVCVRQVHHIFHRFIVTIFPFYARTSTFSFFLSRLWRTKRGGIDLLWGFLSRLWRAKRAGVPRRDVGEIRFGLWRVKFDVGFVAVWAVCLVLDFAGVCGVRSAVWVCVIQSSW